MFRWVRLYLHQILSCREILFHGLPEQILDVTKSGTTLLRYLFSANVYSQGKEPEQNSRYDRVCYASHVVPHPHQSLDASKRIELRLYCLSLTHCLVYVEISASDTAKCLTIGVASSFTGHRLGHPSSISTLSSSQLFLSTSPPLLSSSSFQVKPISPLLFHNHLHIPALTTWPRASMTTLSTLLMKTICWSRN